jgi:hypothetical protein
MAEPRCYYCGPTARELRPYGPGGADVCPCVFDEPDREAGAKAAFFALSDAAEAAGGGVVVLTGDGPQPGSPQAPSVDGGKADG